MPFKHLSFIETPHCVFKHNVRCMLAIYVEFHQREIAFLVFSPVVEESALDARNPTDLGASIIFPHDSYLARSWGLLSCSVLPVVALFYIVNCPKDT